MSILKFSKSGTKTKSRAPEQRLERRHHQSFPHASKRFSNQSAGLVSVVIPVYNHAEFISASIKSILSETEIELECIVINDGSTDDLKSAVKPYLSDNRLQYFEKENGGVADALNYGFARARGDFLSWISADNLYLAGGLKKLRDYLLANPSVALSYANVRLIDEDSKPLRDCSYRPEDQAHPGSDLLFLPYEGSSLVHRADNFINSAFMYRREDSAAIAGYSSDLLGAEDYDYWLRISRFGYAAHIDCEEPAASYRIHKNSLTHTLETNSLVDLTKKLQVEELEFRTKEDDVDIKTSSSISGFLNSLGIETTAELEDKSNQLIFNGSSFQAQLLNTNSNSKEGRFIEIKNDSKGTKLILPHALEVSPVLKRARSSYFRSSEGLGERIALVISDSPQTVELITSLAEVQKDLGFLILTAEEKLYQELPILNSRARVFQYPSGSEEDSINSLLYCLSSVDFILEPSSDLTNHSLAAAAAIPIITSRTESSSLLKPIPPQRTLADFNNIKDISDKIEGLEEITTTACDQWLESLSQDSLKHKLISYLKSNSKA